MFWSFRRVFHGHLSSTLAVYQKLDFVNNVQLCLTLAALSLGLWWTFDRSRSGFGLGLTTAFFATLITQLLVYNGIYQYAITSCYTLISLYFLFKKICIEDLSDLSPQVSVSTAGLRSLLAALHLLLWRGDGGEHRQAASHG